MVRVGAVTIGQSPRDDVIPEIKEITGPNVEFVECGALDGLSLEQVRRLAPKAGDYVLVTRMRDGMSVTLAERHIILKLRECVQKLEKAKVDLVAMLCTGVFPELRSRKLILRPDRLLEQTVRAMIEKGTIGVVTPTEEQITQAHAKWKRLGLNVIVDHALPYATEEQVTAVARRLAKTEVDLIVLDCIGFNTMMKKTVRDITKKPVILPRTLLARAISELVA